MEIPLEQNTTDIYSKGFDKSLNKVGTNPIDSPIVYNEIDNTVGQGISFGNLQVGSKNTNITTDPKTGFWIGNANFSSAPFKVDMQGNLTATSATINGYVLSSKGSFGGDGSDGALTITAGTTTLSAASATIFRKNYTSISITGTAKLAFSTPNANGTMIFLKSQGAVTVTSSTVPAIDASSMGAAADTKGNGILSNTNFGVQGGLGGNGPIQGSGGAGGVAIVESTFDGIKFYKLWSGAGGATGRVGPISGAAGTGGIGGGALVIECNGAYNVTSTITVAGGIGGNGAVGINTNATFGNSGGGGGGAFVTSGAAGTAGSGTDGNKGSGGGGGAGGTIIVMYNILTANTGTYTVSGSAGGTGASDGAGSAGNGGTGGNGYSLIQLNSNFA